MDADDIGAWVYGRANADEEDPPGPVALALALGVPVVRSDAHGPRDAVLDDGIIRVSRRATGRRLCWAVAHELAELSLRIEGYRGSDIEALADSGAAAIIMPRRGFLKHLRHLTLADLSRFYDLSCTAVSLRYGETTGRPVAVIAPTHVHVRGEAFEWGDLPGLARAKAPPPGFDRVRLADDRRRVRLIAG